MMVQHISFGIGMHFHWWRLYVSNRRCLRMGGTTHDREKTDVLLLNAPQNDSVCIELLLVPVCHFSCYLRTSVCHFQMSVQS
jgi:hypothetical protein